MTVQELRHAVRQAVSSDMQVEETDDGCIVSRDGKEIQFWVQNPTEESFYYTRTIAGKSNGLGPLRSDDASDVLLYL